MEIKNMIMKKICLYILVCMFIGYSCDDMNEFEQGTLSGYVLDAVTGEGLADVDVVLEPVVAANGLSLIHIWQAL